MEVYIIRHGTTESNLRKIVQGQLDTPLTPHGVKEAEHLAHQLKNIRFDAIFSSDLGRAFITEFIIAKLDHEEELIHEDKALREINYGDYQNHTSHDIAQACPEYKHDPDFVFPNGESPNQAKQRAVDFVKSLEGKYDKVLIVTHSGIIRALKGWATAEYDLKEKISHTYIGKIIIMDSKPQYESVHI